MKQWQVLSCCQGQSKLLVSQAGADLDQYFLQVNNFIVQHRNKPPQQHEATSRCGLDIASFVSLLNKVGGSKNRGFLCFSCIHFSLLIMRSFQSAGRCLQKVAFSGLHRALIGNAIKTELRNLHYFQFKNCSKIYICTGVGEIAQNKIRSKFANTFCEELYVTLKPTSAAIF